MYNLKIDPNEFPVKIEISYFGLLTVSYVYSLWERDSNHILESKNGNNLNSDDDVYYLPLPSTQNSGRMIELFSTINNPETEIRPETIAIKATQNGILLFTDEEQNGINVNSETFTIVEPVSVPASSTILNDIFILLS